MNIRKLLIISSAMIILSQHNLPAKADQVRIFGSPPSAEELGKILFGADTKDSNGVSTRSINFNAKSKKPMVNSQSVWGERKSVGLPIEFAYNSTAILPDSRPFLDEVGKMLNMSDYAIKNLIIEGHTDAKGSDNYNFVLSKRRARAVSDYLVKHFGVSRKRLQAQGLGETKPLEGRNPFDEVNRRVEFYSAN
jgi:OmpA-OmpF porin, OOP family